MKRLGIALVLGAALGLAALADPAAVKLAPAEEEVKALREAWAKVLNVFEGFVVEFKGAVTTLNSNDQDLLGKYRALAAQLADLEAKFMQLQELCGQKIPALEKGLSDCLSQIAVLRKSLEDVIAGYKAADAALEAKIAALAAQIDQLSSRVSVLESYDIGNLSRRVLSLEQAIQAVQIKIENNREKIAALEKTLGGFAADISALKGSVANLETKVSDHDARIATVEKTLGTNVQDLSARLDTVQAIAILGLLAGIGALVVMLLGIGG
ncbi:MAG: hypothetical protein NZ651_03300 [Candidatus Bipolaricaulota bacterium]|nr:hypothetical protein [Candidatus Bipolaricaulota bacterium]MDW8126780.1 hypothetical protein [Candidatus Bipolaricaulota bacterium]